MLVWLIVGALAVATLWFGAVFTITSFVVRPRRMTLDSAFSYFGPLGESMRQSYHALKREPFTVTADDGVRLSCEWVTPPQPLPQPHVVIFVHGFGFNRVAAMKYLPMFLRRGYHAVLFDHRNSGESGGTHTTFGAKERHDLTRIVDAVFARCGESACVGTVGESMGGATVLLHAAEDPRLRFVVADCAYADCHAQLAYTFARKAGVVGRLMLPLAAVLIKLRAGFSIRAVSPVRELADLRRPLPILFAHGTADTVVPYAHHAQLIAAYQGPKVVFVGENSRHTRSAVDNPEAYETAVEELLTKAEQFQPRA